MSPAQDTGSTEWSTVAKVKTTQSRQRLVSGHRFSDAETCTGKEAASAAELIAAAAQATIKLTDAA
jgi:hypothetical protein